MLASPIQAGIFPPEEDEGSDDHGADRVPEPLGGPDGTVQGPARESGGSEGGDADCGAYGSADDAGKERELENVLQAFKGMATSAETIDQVARDGTLKRVTDSDGERGGESAGGGEVHQKRASQDGGPNAVAENQEGGDGDTGAGPNGCGAGIHERQS